MHRTDTLSVWWLLLASTIGWAAEAPSLSGHRTTEPPAASLRVIAQDERYTFAGHGFGAGGVDGEASLYVFNAGLKQWARLDLITTRNALLGHSPDINQDYVAVPLCTGGSVLLPDKIEFDADRGFYRLTHGKTNGQHARPTVLAILRDDLDALFAGTLPAVAIIPALRDNLLAPEFAAALRRRWDTVDIWHVDRRAQVVSAEFRADDTATVVVRTGEAIRSHSGAYRLEFERPPAPNMCTRARITVLSPEGGLVLSQVTFTAHNGLGDSEQLFLRIMGNPGGTLDRNSASGDIIEGVRVGLRAAKTVWRTNEKPEFALSARFLGDRQFRVPGDHRLLQIEVDGRWHAWGEPRTVPKPMVPFGVDAARGVEMTVPLTGPWYAVDHQGPRLLTLAPGRHLVRVAFEAKPDDGRSGIQGLPGAGAPPQPVRAISNPIVIEVAARPDDGARTGAAPDAGQDLPGAQKTLIEVAGTNYNLPPWVTPVVVKCLALSEGSVQEGLGVEHVRQDFLLLEPIIGAEELRPGPEAVFRIDYDHLTPPRFQQRPIRRGEAVLWIIHRCAAVDHYAGLMALADTPANRTAVLEVFGELTLERRQAVLWEALGAPTPTKGAELETRLRWVLRDVLHVLATYDNPQVANPITLDRITKGPVPDSWVRQLTAQAAQGHRLQALEIRITDPVATAWLEMIRAMQAADKAALAKVCTEKGYQSIVAKGDRNQEATAEDLCSWGRSWSRQPFLNRRISGASVMLSVGSEVKSSGFEFIQTPEGWKLDRFYPGK